MQETKVGLRGLCFRACPLSITLSALVSPFHLHVSSIPISLALYFSCKTLFPFALTISPLPTPPYPDTINTQKPFVSRDSKISPADLALHLGPTPCLADRNSSLSPEPLPFTGRSVFSFPWPQRVHINTTSATTATTPALPPIKSFEIPYYGSFWSFPLSAPRKERRKLSRGWGKME